MCAMSLHEAHTCRTYPGSRRKSQSMDDEVTDAMVTSVTVDQTTPQRTSVKRKLFPFSLKKFYYARNALDKKSEQVPKIPADLLIKTKHNDAMIGQLTTITSRKMSRPVPQ